MLMKLFSVFDNKARLYNPPFGFPETGQALRAFKNAANNREHGFGMNPEDYCLYQIGTFDDSTGLISHLDPMLNLGMASEFVLVVQEDSSNEVVE
jgi:hypothetical protein